jgi:hypothetical protein
MARYSDRMSGHQIRRRPRCAFAIRRKRMHRTCRSSTNRVPESTRPRWDLQRSAWRTASTGGGRAHCNAFDPGNDAGIDGDLPAEFHQRLLATLHLVVGEHDGNEPDEAQDEGGNVRFQFPQNWNVDLGRHRIVGGVIVKLLPKRRIYAENGDQEADSQHQRGKDELLGQLGHFHHPYQGDCLDYRM